MLRSAAFNMGLHCLPKYTFISSQNSQDLLDLWVIFLPRFEKVGAILDFGCLSFCLPFRPPITILFLLNILRTFDVILLNFVYTLILTRSRLG